MENTPENLINVVDPDTQQVGSIPQAQLSDAMAQGYSQATPEQVHTFVNEQKYGTLPQQLLTGVEGAGEASTFGLSAGLERGLHNLGVPGISPEEVRARREENPKSHLTGEIAGLTGTAALGIGEGAILGKLGAGAADAVGLAAPTTALSKIGSMAVRNAVESALVGGQDEVAKMMMSDPDQSVQTAITNVGLSGLIGAPVGAAIGSISPLWKATAGSKIESLLKFVSDKSGGLENVVPSEFKKAIEESGIVFAPEVKTLLSDQPWLKQTGEKLLQTDTNASGLSFQKAFKEGKKSASDAILNTFGKTADDIIPKSQLSEYEAGKNIGKTLSDELKQSVDPLAEKFEGIREKYNDLPLPQDTPVEVPQKFNPYGTSEPKFEIRPGASSQMIDKISQLSVDEGWASSPSSDIMREVKRVIKELPEQTSLKDLSNYGTQIGNNTYDFTNPALSRAGQLMKNILRDTEGDVLTSQLAKDAPELIAEHAQARKAWSELSDLKDSLNDRLHIKGGNSVGSFVKNLNEAAQEGGEKILRRLSGKSDADLLKLLQDRFPKTAEAVKNYHLSELLGTAADKAGADEALNSKKILSDIQKLSPELRNFILSPEAQQKLGSVAKVLEGLESKSYNFSNTARTVDKLLGDVPSTAMGIAAAFLTHNPVVGAVTAPLTKWIGRDIPDAIRLSMLRFLGSDKPIQAEGFKAMVDMIQHTIEGENLLTKSSKALLKSSGEVLPHHLIPNDKDLKKLDTHLEKLKTDPSPLFEVGGSSAHYLPDHGTAMGQTAANAVNYLNTLRPSVDKKAPLDAEIKPSKMAQAQYDRALTIADQPLVIFNHIQKGTLTPHDVSTLKALYPALYGRMASKVMNEVIESQHKEVAIPYQKRLGLSLFLGQPLDSTMTPLSILSTQPKPSQTPAPQKAFTGLQKLSESYQTPGQARDTHRQK